MDNGLWNGKLLIATDISKTYDFEKEVRIASGQKELCCPDSECQHPVLRYCHGEEKDAYFAHLNNACCDYANFDRENTRIMRTIRRMLYEHFKAKGFQVRPEVKVLNHHYTHLLFDMVNGNTVAVEIGTKSLSANRIDKLTCLYRQKGIAVKWIVIDNTQANFCENQTYFLKRFLLNESLNRDLIVVSWDGAEVAQYKCDTNIYENNGFCFNSNYYPGTYVEVAPVNALTFKGDELSLDGFMERYDTWLIKKRNAFNKMIASHKEQERQREKVRNRLYKENQKQLKNGFHGIVQPSYDAPKLQKTPEMKPPEMDISYEVRRNEVIPKIEQQVTQVRDSLGIRWIKCEKCGTVETDDKFCTYGGQNHINMGVCYKCSRRKR